VAANGGWVSYGDGRVKLVDVQQATFTPKFGRTPTAPPGTTPWRARLRFGGNAKEAFAGCQIELEDGQGRRFQINPNELLSA
jgi:hypothetical protein